MAIETLDDIIEDLANQINIYGAHGEAEECSLRPTCRCCFTSNLKRRIEDAMEIEAKLRRSGDGQ